MNCEKGARFIVFFSREFGRILGKVFGRFFGRIFLVD